MNLHDHFTTIVKGALKEAALGEPFDFAVSPPAIWPMMDGDRPVGAGPCWLITVAIRNPIIGEPDICHARTVVGLLPTADLFKQTAVKVLDECRESREKNTGALAQARAAFRQNMKEATA